MSKTDRSEVIPPLEGGSRFLETLVMAISGNPFEDQSLAAAVSDVASALTQIADAIEAQDINVYCALTHIAEAIGAHRADRK